MKRLLLALLLFCGSALAQIDIPINAIGPVKDIARNVTWAGSGPAAVNNNYIIAPTYQFETACFFITNNDVGAHTPVINFFGTGDQNVTKYQGNTGAWSVIGPNTSFFAQSIAAGTTTVYGVTVQNTARFVAVISNGSGAGTVTVTLVESPGSSGCRNLQNPGLPIVCNVSVNVTGLASAATTLVQLGNPGQAIYVCNVTVTSSAALAAGNISVIEGTGGACGGSTLTVATLLTATTTPNIFSLAGTPLIPRFPAGSASDNVGLGLCITNNQATTVNVLISYAQF